MSHTLGGVRPKTMIEQLETNSMNEKKTRALKICPLTRKPCLTRNCSLWIRIQKQPPNPFWKLTYEGCGLINHIPFTPKEHEKGRNNRKGGEEKIW